MKKILASLLVFSLFVCSFTAFAAESGKIAVVTLRSNPSTGYTWSYSVDQEDMVSETAHSFTSLNPNAIGSYEREQWNFKGLKEGDVTITFVYSRHWAASKEDRCETFVYHIDSDLNMHLVSIK